LVIEGQAETWEEALSLTYSELYKNGYVRESFLSACIEREKHLPTGLPTEIGVAIPHTDAEHVIIPAICMLQLKKPVAFRNMGDPDSVVKVHYIFNMALKESNDQVSMLKSIIHLVRDERYLAECKNKSLKKIRKELLKLWCGGTEIETMSM